MKFFLAFYVPKYRVSPKTLKGHVTQATHAQFDLNMNFYRNTLLHPMIRDTKFCASSLVECQLIDASKSK